jgi:hypothetical protein
VEDHVKLQDTVQIKGSSRTGVIQIIEIAPHGRLAKYDRGVLVEFTDQKKPSRDWFGDTQLTVIQERQDG